MGTQGAKMDEIRWQPVVQGWEVTLLPIYRNAEMIEVFAEEKRTPTFLFSKQNYVVVEQPIWNKNSSQKWIIIPKFRGKHPEKKMIHQNLQKCWSPIA